MIIAKKFYLLKISYDGSGYFGFVKQKNKPTVQETLEIIFSKTFNHKIKLYYSSRTDKGVHAIDQAIAFSLSAEINLLNRKKALNCTLLKQMIAINSINQIKSLKLSKYIVSKTYCYKFYFTRRNLFLEKYYTYHEKVLKKDKLKQILNNFVGTHNFYNFTKKEEIKDINNYVRTINKIKIKTPRKNFLEIYFTGPGFLRYMIRKMVSAAIDCYNERITLNELINLIFMEKICPYPRLAPANGLYLLNINFKTSLFL